MIERVTFPAGPLALEGLLEGPDDVPVWAGAVFCHPHPLYGGNMHNNVVAQVASALAEAGLAVLRFNFRGVGRSEGRYGEGEAEQADVRAALGFLRGVEGMAGKPLVAVGYSFGAAVAARAACADAAGAAALVCIALPIGFAGPGAFDALRACPLPKLFLTGSEDDICPPPRLRELADRLPEPKALVVLDATDHFFHCREPDLAAHISRFLAAFRLPG